MAINTTAYRTIREELDAAAVTLVAVSKTKPVSDISALYELGQRDFGENYVQELVEKAAVLPDSVRWHFIGHLQTNKVKLIAPFVQLIHGVDSLRLLEEIDRQATRNNRVIDCLLQVHIATETTKFGLDEGELFNLLEQWMNKPPTKVRIRGLMGMASFTDDLTQVKREFAGLKKNFDRCRERFPGAGFDILSMGMSGDYKLAVAAGSTLVRIGSLLFGERSVG